MNLIKLTQFPMTINAIPTFERLNKLNTNVFGSSVDNETLSPKYVSKNYYDQQIDLLLYENQFC